MEKKLVKVAYELFKDKYRCINQFTWYKNDGNKLKNISYGIFINETSKSIFNKLIESQIELINNNAKKEDIIYFVDLIKEFFNSWQNTDQQLSYNMLKLCADKFHDESLCEKIVARKIDNYEEI